MKLKHHHYLLLALVLGSILGVSLHPYADNEFLIKINANLFNPIGQIFLRMIFMVVVPMLCSALIMGVYELGKSQGLGKVAARTLFFTIVASSISVLVGIGLVNVMKPGVGVSVNQEVLSEQSAAVAKLSENAMASKSFAQIIVDLIPKNPFEAAVKAFDGEIVALMVFALFFGFALSKVHNQIQGGNTMLSFMEDLYNVCMQIVSFAMKLAPVAVFCLVFQSGFKFGLDIFQSLLWYIATVILGLLIQQFVVYTSLLKIFTKISPIHFFKECRDVLVYAFSTASSNASLPKALETAEKKLKLPSNISRFVLTVGSTANQNGTALFEGVTVLFLAQVYGIDLSFSQQLLVVLMSILAGVGTAGVPGGSLPLIMILLQSVGIPAEGIGLIIGVDRLLDMCRTTINVSGDLVMAALVASSEEKSNKT